MGELAWITNHLGSGSTFYTGNREFLMNQLGLLQFQEWYLIWCQGGALSRGIVGKQNLIWNAKDIDRIYDIWDHLAIVTVMRLPIPFFFASALEFMQRT